MIIHDCSKASYCTIVTRSQYLDCYAGTVDRNNHGDTSVTQKVRGVGVWHSKYGKNDMENDIGVVRLQKALELGRKYCLKPLGQFISILITILVVQITIMAV